MSSLRIVRVVPGMRNALRRSHKMGHFTHNAVIAPACVRCFNRPPWRRDPFTQMEEFMRDMERKFKRDIENTLNTVFRELPQFSEAPVVTRKPKFGQVEDVSTSDTYKITFSFPNAKPEDVKVSIKGQTLTVSGKAEDVTETSQSSHQVEFKYQMPEDVNLDGLESSLSNEGILTIEAPRFSPEPPKATTIEINRE